MNVKQFNGLDSFCRRQDGTEMNHGDIYSNVVNAIGLKVCERYIPATKEEILEALKTDKHLSNIPLKKWDFASGYTCSGSHVNKTHQGFKDVMIKSGINELSLSDCVCTLKQAAIMLVNYDKS